MTHWWKNATVGNVLDKCDDRLRRGGGVTVSAAWLRCALKRLAKEAGEEWKPGRITREGGAK